MSDEKFTCAICDGTFEKIWSDEEAMREVKAAWGEDITDFVAICDVCYTKLLRR